MSLWNLKPTQTKLNVQKPYLESQTILWEETCPGTKRINQHHMGGKTRTHTKENIVKITGVFETQQYHCRITGFNMFGIKSYLIHNHWTCGSYLIQSSVRNIWPSPTTSWFIDFETPGSHLHLPWRNIHLNGPERRSCSQGSPGACHPWRSNDNQPWTQPIQHSKPTNNHLG